jgi:hypothetical protein
VSTEIATTTDDSSYAEAASATFCERIGPTLGERSLISAIKPNLSDNAAGKGLIVGASETIRRISASGRLALVESSSARTSAKISSRKVFIAKVDQRSNR